MSHRHSRERSRAVLLSLVGWSFATCMGLFLVGPIALVIVSSFGGGRFLQFPPTQISLVWYKAFISDPAWVDALLASIGIATMVVLLSVPLAGGAAYWVERSRSRWRAVVLYLLIMPALIPVIVFAVAFSAAFTHLSSVGDWGRLILAHTVLALPYAFLIMRTAIARCDRDLENAARTLGATTWTVLRMVLLPMLRWPVATSALLTFIVSFTEPALPIFLTSGQTATLSEKTWEGLRYGIDQRTIVGTTLFIYALTLMLMGIVAARVVPRLLPKKWTRGNSEASLWEE